VKTSVIMLSDDPAWETEVWIWMVFITNADAPTLPRAAAVIRQAFFFVRPSSKVLYL
jgi:hypothetical protein